MRFMRKIFANPSRDSLDEGKSIGKRPARTSGLGAFSISWEIQDTRAQAHAEDAAQAQRIALAADRRRKGANGGRRALRQKDEEEFELCVTCGDRAADASPLIRPLVLSKLRRRPARTDTLK